VIARWESELLEVTHVLSVVWYVICEMWYEERQLAHLPAKDPSEASIIGKSARAQEDTIPIQNTHSNETKGRGQRVPIGLLDMQNYLLYWHTHVYYYKRNVWHATKQALKATKRSTNHEPRSTNLTEKEKNKQEVEPNTETNQEFQQDATILICSCKHIQERRV
jgi:hypothetical protein